MASGGSSGRDPPGNNPPRQFGTCVALWGFHSSFRAGRAERLPRRVLGVRDGLMISDDIRDEVHYAQEVRDLARQAHRLLREEAREPLDGDLPDFRAVLRRIDSLRQQISQERRSDLLRWLERLRHRSRGVGRCPPLDCFEMGEGWMSEGVHQVETISHSKRAAVPPERVPAGRERRPLEGRQDSPAGRDTSWVLVHAELREGSSHESCLA